MSRRKGQRSRAPLDSDHALAYHVSSSIGGQLKTLSDKEKYEINDGVFHILSEIGFEQLPGFLDCFVDNKTVIKKNNRYCFGIELVERCLKSFNKDILLYQQNKKDYLDISNRNVYCGTGGAAPLILDYEKKIYRPSLKTDLLSAARVVDKLGHLSFFSRPLVLTDISDPHLMDIYTAIISLSATQKHV